MEFIAVYNPKLCHKEGEEWKQVLLYHSFQETNDEPIPLNEKLSLIGIMQGIWNFTHNFSMNSADLSMKYIDTRLDHCRLLAVEVERDYFLAFGVEDDNYYPSAYYIKELYHSYNFFCMKCGSMGSFRSSEELTDKLNEYFVTYWYDLMLLPEAIYASNLTNVYWHEGFKVGELDICTTQWETYIKHQILLDDESYLGLKDICVYKLPRDRQNHPRQYGMIRNFTPEFKSLPVLSNWIYNLDRIFDSAFSPHVLSDHVRLLRPDESDIDSDGHLKQSIGRQLWDNVTMPISMTYDAISEVGNLAGINAVVHGINKITTGLNTMTNKFAWPKSKTASPDLKSPSVRHGFLISALSLDSLPEAYKYRRFQLQFESDNSPPKWYKVLFWHYNDYLFTLIFEDDFKRIWDPKYLEELNIKLFESMTILQESVVNPQGDSDKFAYAVLNKETNRIESSIPTTNFNRKDDSTSSPLQLIVSGIDDTLRFLVSDQVSPSTTLSFSTLPPTQNSPDDAASRTRSTGENSETIRNPKAGGVNIFNWKSSTEKPHRVTSKADNDTSFSSLSYEKLLELNVELCKMYSGVLKSECKRDSVMEEKLIKLSNGILCYIGVSSKEVVVIVKNWFLEDRNVKYLKPGMNKRDTNIMINSLGKDVRKWWDDRSTKL
ncbi:HBL104Wp [Eremothecium sinecaudum]|uniref:HBL104Wp n=1 Tax=Eremothecium sinecaudum TaxID=45286 RepID=A0A109UWD8_9SACH|nr:HBL104Wp [Eremothecium sinecaudum]AMD18798.1 HBL104Wp [Eremothecium sinecaudum]